MFSRWVCRSWVDIVQDDRVHESDDGPRYSRSAGLGSDVQSVQCTKGWILCLAHTVDGLGPKVVANPPIEERTCFLGE